MTDGLSLISTSRKMQMSRSLLWLGVASIFISASWDPPASADVDVVPDSYAPSVTVGATEKVSPRNAVDVHDGSARIKAEFECDQGPGARAAGLSCRVTSFPGTWSPLPIERDLGDIERAIREVPMPPLKVQIQPDARTLVNVDTIFYTNPTHLSRTVTLLGHSVRLDAQPGQVHLGSRRRHDCNLGQARTALSREGRHAPVPAARRRPARPCRHHVSRPLQRRRRRLGDPRRDAHGPRSDHFAGRRRGRTSAHPLTRFSRQSAGATMARCASPITSSTSWATPRS